MPVIPPSFLHSSLISRSVLSVQGENELALSDIELLEWFRNDGLKVEWCPLSFQGVASSQSTHHPLQRMMGGLTCCFEWHLNDYRMINQVDPLVSLLWKTIPQSWPSPVIPHYLRMTKWQFCNHDHFYAACLPPVSESRPKTFIPDMSDVARRSTT